MELMLTRHGLPESARSDEAVDPPLSEKGREQALRLGQWLARVPARTPDLIVASTMRRAEETAQLVAEHVDAGVQLDERLVEFDHGAGFYEPPELAHPADIDEMWRSLESGRWGEHVFDPDQFEDRVCKAFDELIARHAGKRVAVVCHGGVINSFLGVILGRPRGFFVRLEYTSFSRLEASGSTGGRRLCSLNEVPHLMDLAALPAGSLVGSPNTEGQRS